jgi:hypothetical protein
LEQALGIERMNVPRGEGRSSSTIRHVRFGRSEGFWRVRSAHKGASVLRGHADVDDAGLGPVRGGAGVTVAPSFVCSSPTASPRGERFGAGRRVWGARGFPAGVRPGQRPAGHSVRFTAQTCVLRVASSVRAGERRTRDRVVPSAGAAVVVDEPKGERSGERRRFDQGVRDHERQGKVLRWSPLVPERSLAGCAIASRYESTLCRRRRRSRSRPWRRTRRLSLKTTDSE